MKILEESHQTPQHTCSLKSEIKKPLYLHRVVKKTFFFLLPSPLFYMFSKCIIRIIYYDCLKVVKKAKIPPTILFVAFSIEKNLKEFFYMHKRKKTTQKYKTKLRKRENVENNKKH